MSVPCDLEVIALLLQKGTHLFQHFGRWDTSVGTVERDFNCCGVCDLQSSAIS